jgi:putative membrane protein insertion efficiency factor
LNGFEHDGEMDKYLKRLALLVIQFYQYFLSPFFGKSCRFYPTCSEYSKLCFEKYHWSKAMGKTCVRLCKCGPWHEGGEDLP